MPECSEPPKPDWPAAPWARISAASCPKSPPAPPYSSGMDAHRKPLAPASSQASRSIMPCARQASSLGPHCSLKKRVADSSSILCSSVIQVDAKLWMGMDGLLGVGD